jgi:hypothetical protein
LFQHQTIAELAAVAEAAEREPVALAPDGSPQAPAEFPLARLGAEQLDRLAAALRSADEQEERAGSA